MELLPPDVTCSQWRYTPERAQAGGRWALRTGLCAVGGLGEAAWARIAAARSQQPFAGLHDFCARTRLGRDAVANLVRAGACDAFGARRDLLWQLGEIEFHPDELSLETDSTPANLPALAPLEQTAWEYELLGLSPGGQIMRHYRAQLRAQRVLSAWEVKQAEPGRRVRVAGMMAVRQRPATAKGIVFISLEDDSGLLDLVVKPDTWARLRDVLRGSMLLLVEGTVQRSGRAASLLVQDAAALAAPPEDV